MMAKNNHKNAKYRSIILPAIYSGATEKWHRQPFEQSPLFKGLKEKIYAIFWGSGYNSRQRKSLTPSDSDN